VGADKLLIAEEAQAHSGGFQLHKFGAEVIAIQAMVAIRVILEGLEVVILEAVDLTEAGNKQLQDLIVEH